MKTHSKAILPLCVVLFGILTSHVARAQLPQAQKPTTNVEGRWTVYLVNTNGTTATQVVDFEQNGHSLTGHFKGPDQSGEITGSVNGGRYSLSDQNAQCSSFQWPRLRLSGT